MAGNSSPCHALRDLPLRGINFDSLRVPKRRRAPLAGNPSPCHALRVLPLRGINFGSLRVPKRRRAPPDGELFSLARLEGFEPPAFWSVARRSIQLS